MKSYRTKLIIILILSSLALSAALMLFGCWGGVKLSDGEIEDLWEPNSVEVIGLKPDGNHYSHASGVVFSYKADGEMVEVDIVTNCHVIVMEKAEIVCESAKIKLSGETEFLHTAEVVAYSPYHDIAVLRFKDRLGEGYPDKFIDFNNPAGEGYSFTDFFASPSVGDEQFSFGYDDEKGSIVMSAGECTQTKTIMRTNYVFGGVKEKYVPVFETTANVKSGKSGGAIVNRYGQIVGIGTYHGEEDKFYAVNATLVRKIYELALKVDPDSKWINLFDYTDDKEVVYRTFLNSSLDNIDRPMNVLSTEQFALSPLGLKGTMTNKKTLSVSECGSAITSIVSPGSELQYIDSRGFSSYIELMEVLYDYTVVPESDPRSAIDISITPTSGNTVKKPWAGAGYKVVKK